MRPQYAGILVVVVSAVLSGCTGTPSTGSPAIGEMQQAASADQCTVVEKGCHGKRFAINEQYEEQWQEKHGSEVCTAVLMPIDELDYTTTFDDGTCRLEASLPDRCTGNTTERQRCEQLESVLQETYQ